MVLNVFFTWPD